MADLIDIAVLTPYLQKGGATDPSIPFLVSATSADFMRAINRPDFFPAATYSETREGDGGTYMTLRHYPVNSVAGITVGGTALPTDTFTVDVSEDPERTRQVFLTSGSFTDTAPIVVTYSAGYVQVPEDVQGAVAEWVAAKMQGRSFAGLKTMQAADRERADPTDEAMPPNVLRVIEKYTKELPSLQRREQHQAPPSEAKKRA